MQARGESIKTGTESRGNEGIERKDLGGLWAIVVLFSLLCTLVGLAWEPVRYELIPSSESDPMEAMVQNRQNQLLVDVLNQQKITFDPLSMGKIIAPRPFWEVFLLDVARVLLFPTIPIVAFATLIHKTLRETKGLFSFKRKKTDDR